MDFFGNITGLNGSKKKDAPRNVCIARKLVISRSKDTRKWFLIGRLTTHVLTRKTRTSIGNAFIAMLYKRDLLRSVVLPQDYLDHGKMLFRNANEKVPMLFGTFVIVDFRS